MAKIKPKISRKAKAAKNYTGGQDVQIRLPDGSIETVNTASPLYAQMYDANQIQSTLGTEAEPINLQEVTVRPPKGFWEQSYDKFQQDNKDSEFIGAMLSPFTYALSVPQQAMMYGATGKVQDPSEALGIENPYAAFAVNAVLDPSNLVGAGLADDAFKFSNRAKNLFRKGFKKPIEVPAQLPGSGNVGNYQNILNKGLDIHDIRLKYHNNMILDFDEVDMLNKFGKGNKTNYERALVKDIAGKMHTDDVSPKIEGISKKNILDHFTGTEQPKVAIPDKSVKPLQNDKSINLVNFEQEQNIIKPPKFEIPSFRSDPYQRTSTSRAADKWLEDWFYNPETKQKFINYGGTESEWQEVLNSLENPIKSNYTWGKNQPGGVYMKLFDQASIPLNATVDVGVHEGIHKAKLLLDNKNPILHRLWNDFTDAVRLTPSEAYPEIFRFRQKLGLKPGQTIDLKTMEDNLHLIGDGYSLPYKIKDESKLLEIINKAPAVVPYLGTGYLGYQGLQNAQQPQQQEYKQGGSVSDWEIVDETVMQDDRSVEKNKKILKEKGILPEQEFQRNKYQENLSNNLFPIGYDLNNFINALHEKNKKRQNLENEARDSSAYASNLIPKSRLDAFNFYMGKPQKYNTFDVSNYRPSKETDSKTNYYKLNYFQDYYAPDSNVTDLENLFKTKSLSLAEMDFPFLFSKKEKQKVGAADAPVMANYTLSKGEDEKGKYYSYYDKWDISPMDFGKPFEIYDRIYYDPETNKIVPPKKQEIPPNIKINPFGSTAIPPQFKSGGSIKTDPQGYWNKENHGKPVRIPSNQITMQGVDQPLYGIDNTGYAQMMYPGEDYIFPGDYVTEYPLPEAGGGYRVIRSNERKGKTHKVIGPGGKVKFFGDSKLGQHPKDPARKKAFYARHKKNLAGNPYFRAFARKTWAEGGMLPDLAAMAFGGNLILEKYQGGGDVWEILPDTEWEII